MRTLDLTSLTSLLRARGPKSRSGMWVWIATATLVSLVGDTPLAHAGVDDFHALLLPPVATGEIGDTIDVTFEVDATAMQFNAYEIKLQFDPDIVSFLDVAEGSLFTSACGSNFTNLMTTDSTITYAHSILCGGVSLDGPGVLSRYRFVAQADGSSPLTVISDPNRSFFDNGIFVSPLHPTLPRQVIFTNNELVVGTSSDAPLPWMPTSSLEVQVSPNPASDHMVFAFGGAGGHGMSEPGLVELFDTVGRRVGAWTVAAEARSLHIDVSDLGHGERPPESGVFFYRVRFEDGQARGSLRIVR